MNTTVTMSQRQFELFKKDYFANRSGTTRFGQRFVNVFMKDVDQRDTIDLFYERNNSKALIAINASFLCITAEDDPIVEARLVEVGIVTANRKQEKVG